MSRAAHKTRLVRTTVVAAAAGAVVLSPLPSESQAPQGRTQQAGASNRSEPNRSETAARSTEPVAIHIGSTAEYTRIEFGGVIGSRARVRREGSTVIVRIGTTAAPDISRLRIDPPAGLEKAETRAVAGGTELILTLAQGAEARSGGDDGVIWLNLYPTAPAGTASSAAVPANGVVPVTATRHGEQVDLKFQWAAPVGAAVFRRGGAVWIVFDASARMAMPQARAMGDLRDARWASGPDFTVVRIAAPAGASVAARGEGAAWTVIIGGPAPTGSSGVEITRDDSGPGALVAHMAGATRAIWLTDPMVGDRFAAVTARAPGKGLSQARRLVDLTLLPTAHGMAIETSTDDVTVAARGDLVNISRPRGLTLSNPFARSQDEKADPQLARASHPAMILSAWGDVGTEGFNAHYHRLQTAAAEEAALAASLPRTPITARVTLARFLVGSGLHYEAIGLINSMARTTPTALGDPEVRGLRGMARTSIGRFAEAEADFSAGVLAGDGSARIWQGYLAAQRGDWAEARRGFSAGAALIDDFPPEWRARFANAHALAALETGDLDASRLLLDYAFGQDVSPEEQLAGRLIQARLFDEQGDKARALRVYKAVARAPLDGISTPARLGVIRLEMASGAMKADVAAQQLEALKWRWRGDGTELAVIRNLGELYLSQGRYREALDALRGAGHRLAAMPGGTQLQADLTNAFRSLFLDGAADGLQPIQALALFYDFRELTPVGADGDEMVRRLSRRLIDVDLLPQAAELLQHQVDNRLEGVAKAQVATDLATVYLMNRQPEQALQAIWKSRTTLLPTAMNTERRALEARALMELGRYDHALELLERDQSPEAREVRAEVYWKQQNWGAAAALYEARLGERYRNTVTPLTAAEESRVIRAGVGYSLAKDATALSRVSRNYRPFIAGARAPSAMRVALEGLDGGSAGDAVGNLGAGADTFASWVEGVKAEIRRETESDAAARAANAPAAVAANAPARPAAQAAAPAAAAPRPAAPAA